MPGRIDTGQRACYRRQCHNALKVALCSPRAYPVEPMNTGGTSCLPCGSTGHRGVVANDPPAFAREVPDGPSGQLRPTVIYDAVSCRVSAHRSGRLFLRKAHPRLIVDLGTV